MSAFRRILSRRPAAPDGFRLVTKTYNLALPQWPADAPPLRIAALADLHIQDPWMSAARLRHVVAETNRLGADLIVILGDLAGSVTRLASAPVPVNAWSVALAGLQAPLGVHGVLGNHDWRDGAGPVFRDGLHAAGVSVYENSAARIVADGHRLWVAGLGSQRALGRRHGIDDLPAALAQVTDDDPIVLLAHEPDIFVDVPPRVAVTLSGHTHGGQVRLPMIGAPWVPSRFGQRFVYGHIVEDERHLVVSGGLGMSGLPIRLGVPPEIVLVTIRSG